MSVLKLSLVERHIVKDINHCPCRRPYIPEVFQHIFVCKELTKILLKILNIHSLDILQYLYRPTILESRQKAQRDYAI